MTALDPGTNRRKKGYQNTYQEIINYICKMKDHLRIVKYSHKDYK